MNKPLSVNKKNINNKKNLSKSVINHDKIQSYDDTFDTSLSDLNCKFIDYLLSDSLHVRMCI